MDFEYELKKAKEKFGENSNVIRLKKINIEEFKKYINKVKNDCISAFFKIYSHIFIIFFVLIIHIYSAVYR